MPKSYYPPVTLKISQKIPKTIYDKYASKPMFRVTLAEELHYKSESRPFRDLITSSAGYGLTSGSYISEKIGLEQAGIDIAQGKTDAFFDALFSIEIFNNFYENFSTGGSKSIPSDRTARDFLHAECGVPERQTQNIFEKILQDARDFYLIQDIAGGEKFVPIELAKEKVSLDEKFLSDNDIYDENDIQSNETYQYSTNGMTDSQNSTSSLDISPRLQLNIEIHIAADTSEEKIELIFMNMRKYLLSDGK